MPRVYVSTYSTYSSGSLKGAWIDLEAFADRAEFLSHCTTLFGSESDHEFMFQDWEDVPHGMISESRITTDIWDWLDLSDSEREIVMAARADTDGCSIRGALDAFCGEYESGKDHAIGLYADCGYLNDDNPLANYVDWDAVVRDLSMDYSYVRHEGSVYVFRWD